MEILKFPNPALLTATQLVAEFGEELSALLEAMYATMKENRGIGLAANQVGLTQRMFVMEGPNEEKIFLVNPEIIGRSSTMANMSEGCLSAPGDFITVYSRVDAVVVRSKNEKGEEQVHTFSGIYAVCVQHEIDHLDGIAFIQHDAVHAKTRKKLKKKWGLQ